MVPVRTFYCRRGVQCVGDRGRCCQQGEEGRGTSFCNVVRDGVWEARGGLRLHSSQKHMMSTKIRTMMSKIIFSMSSPWRSLTTTETPGVMLVDALNSMLIEARMSPNHCFPSFYRLFLHCFSVMRGQYGSNHALHLSDAACEPSPVTCHGFPGTDSCRSIRILPHDHVMHHRVVIEMDALTHVLAR